MGGGGRAAAAGKGAGVTYSNPVVRPQRSRPTEQGAQSLCGGVVGWGWWSASPWRGGRCAPRCARCSTRGCGQELKLVPTSVQLERTRPLSAQLKLTLSPVESNLTRGRVPKVLKLSSHVSECKPLAAGRLPHARRHRARGRGGCGQDTAVPATAARRAASPIRGGARGRACQILPTT